MELNIDPTFIIQTIEFFWYGFTFNLIGLILLSLVALVSYLTFSSHDRELFIDFVIKRQEKINSGASSLRQLMYTLTIFFPFHTFILSLIFLWKVISRMDVIGLILAVICVDDFHLVQIVRYERVVVEYDSEES